MAKAGAALVVSSGLAASMALPASAAPLTGSVAAQRTSVAPTAARPAAEPATRPGARAPDRVSRSTDRARLSAIAQDGGAAETGPADQGGALGTVIDGSARTYVAAGMPGSVAFGAAVLVIAARYEGTPYRYGGRTPAGFDCSGFTSYVMRQVGIHLPHSSGAQRAVAARISRGEAHAGDLVFMPGHVGIYAGGGMMWDSPRSGTSVTRRAVYSSRATYGRVG